MPTWLLDVDLFILIAQVLVETREGMRSNAFKTRLTNLKSTFFFFWIKSEIDC